MGAAPERESSRRRAPARTLPSTSWATRFPTVRRPSGTSAASRRPERPWPIEVPQPADSGLIAHMGCSGTPPHREAHEARLTLPNQEFAFRDATRRGRTNPSRRKASIRCVDTAHSFDESGAASSSLHPPPPPDRSPGSSPSSRCSAPTRRRRTRPFCPSRRRHHASAKSRSRLPRADCARRAHGLHHRQHRGRADLVEVSRPREELRAETTDGAMIAAPAPRTSRARACSRRDELAPLPDLARQGRHPRHRRIPQRRNSQYRGAFFAVRPSCAIFAAYQFARRPRVANHHANPFSQMNGTRRKVTAIEQQSAPGAAQTRGELIEDSAVHPDVLVLGALAELCEALAAHLPAAERAKHHGYGAFERGRRTQPAADRDGAVNHTVESDERQSFRCKRPGHSARIVGPLRDRVARTGIAPRSKTLAR